MLSWTDFPLWHMGISGYEALVMSTVSPFFLASKSFRSFVVHNQRVIHLFSLAGVMAYLIQNPVLRLFTVAFGVSMACLGWAGTLYAEAIHESRLERKVLAWALGLTLSSTIKYAWQTNNPVWPIMHA